MTEWTETSLAAALAADPAALVARLNAIEAELSALKERKAAACSSASAIQNKILAHAGALTQFVNNRIDDPDWQTFIQVLSDAFELDWQGDLRSLPMYVRVKALGFDFLKNVLDQAAILNWWIDLLDFKTPRHLAKMAAR
ncbi:hypothetical protein HK105_206211 [Polyrhizophydium stewartii]|uniref:Uncharacterized protein n=1 Tax=Polyrhizophydium stewartii TaxID=2732419 RepID=A0ABR4N416_9FUNG